MIGINNKQLGYSLVEVMAGVTIFAIITLASVNLFLNTTIGSTKDNSLRTVKQNGNHVISLLENSLRGAARLNPNQEGVTCFQDMESLSIRRLDTNEDEDWYVTDGILYLNGDQIIDNNLRVVDNRLYVDCVYDSGSKYTLVNISFTLSKGSGEAEDKQNNVTQEFETSVSVRNRFL